MDRGTWHFDDGAPLSDEGHRFQVPPAKEPRTQTGRSGMAVDGQNRQADTHIADGSLTLHGPSGQTDVVDPSRMRSKPHWNWSSEAVDVNVGWAEPVRVGYVSASSPASRPFHWSV